MEKLSELPNIGKELERQLKAIEINTYDDLKCLGAEKTWLKIKAIDPSACINRLYALEGAIWGIKKAHLATERKEELKRFYNLNK